MSSQQMYENNDNPQYVGGYSAEHNLDRGNQFDDRYGRGDPLDDKIGQRSTHLAANFSRVLPPDNV